jgi:hypothetical protein
VHCGVADVLPGSCQPTRHSYPCSMKSLAIHSGCVRSSPARIPTLKPAGEAMPAGARHRTHFALQPRRAPHRQRPGHRAPPHRSPPGLPRRSSESDCRRRACRAPCGALRAPAARARGARARHRILIPRPGDPAPDSDASLPAARTPRGTNQGHARCSEWARPIPSRSGRPGPLTARAAARRARFDPVSSRAGGPGRPGPGRLGQAPARSA